MTDSPLTEEELAAIAARAEAATPGPWVECTAAPADTRQVYSQSREHDCIYSGEWVASFATAEDAAFAVAARDDVPRLVAEGRHLRAKLARLRAMLDRCDKAMDDTLYSLYSGSAEFATLMRLRGEIKDLTTEDANP